MLNVILPYICPICFSYYAMCVEFETFYMGNPQKPLWVRVYHEELNKLKPKKLPMSDIHLHEQFKKYFGYKKAIKCKVGHGEVVTGKTHFNFIILR